MPILTSLTRAIALSAALLCAGPFAAAANGTEPVGARVIVKYRSDAAAGAALGANGPERGAELVQHLSDRMKRLAARQGVSLAAQRAISERSAVVFARGVDSATLARRLSADPEVEYAVPDRRVRRLAVPSDPLYTAGGVNGPAAGQWYLRAPNATFRAAIDATTAWDTTQGSASVVVAVLDTGVRFDHPDLGRVATGGKLLPGYDFIDSVHVVNGTPVADTTSNDGDGRDADPSDPGDWVTQQEDNSVGGEYYHCTTPNDLGQYVGEDSSWHGTSVAGIVGALTNNGVGMAGVGWNTRVLPVRVLGKCGGFVSDILAGMRWAAGLAVPGVPANATPARVINLSLGSTGTCGEYQDAVDDVTAAGAVVVAAAGNTNGHAVGAPANCNGVLGVGGLRHTGTKVGFSDLGPAVAISAPAGNCGNLAGPCLYPILSTSNGGTQGPTSSTYSDSYSVTVGTSFSAPMVSGVAALMLAVQPTLTPAQVKALIQGGARPFPTSGADAGTPQCTAPRFTSGNVPIDQDECYCTTANCGAGMLDARAAVRSAAAGLIASIGATPSAPQADQAVTLSATVAALVAGRSQTGVSWTLVDGGGIVSAFEAVSGNQATVRPSAAGSFTVAITVTDNNGTQSTTSQRVTVAAASSGGGGSGGGGGGALGGGYLLALLAAVVAAWRLRAPARA